MRSMAACLMLLAALTGCQPEKTANAPVPEAPVPSAVPPLPEGYVVTPHGLVHRSCVRLIAPGERVNALGTVTRASGEREQLPLCRYPRLNAHTRQPIITGPGVTQAVNGWVEDAYWTSSVPLGSMSANFNVPTAPTSNGATIFFFPGAEPGDGSTILQPVLQYGTSAAGGGNYWTAASWFCCPAGWSNHSTLINVNAGDTMLGTMTSTCSGSSCNWTIVTTDSTSGASTTLAADNVTSQFVWNLGGVLEAYSLTSCAQYPAAGTIAFTNIALKNQSGSPMTPSWTNWVGTVTPTCGYAVTSTPTSATLTY